jgi:hypothetical protein
LTNRSRANPSSATKTLSICPRRTTAPSATSTAGRSRTGTRTRPNWPARNFSAGGKSSLTKNVRLPAEADGAISDTLPVSVTPAASIMTGNSAPMLTRSTNASGISHSKRNSEEFSISSSGLPGVARSPTSTSLRVTTPSKGAEISVYCSMVRASTKAASDVRKRVVAASNSWRVDDPLLRSLSMRA